MKLWRTPFDRAEKATKPGKVVIESERCKGCGYCVEYCPRRVLVMSEEMNSKGYTLAVVTNGNDCLSCGLCETLCPEFAIFLELGNSEN
jgi:2-oxoglutarate ferredoxin oxidoreductase subunit delta